MANERLWVFGYGSLMWNGWESDYTCLEKTVAKLPGYRRVFNKLSVKNWGTKAVPGLTLNLEVDAAATCAGMAFAFPASKRDEVLAYLAQREGKGFIIEPYTVQLADGMAVEALVAIYSGENLRTGMSLDEQVRMIRAARGTSGACIDYVAGIANRLDALDIDDPAVRDLRAAAHMGEDEPPQV